MGVGLLLEGERRGSQNGGMSRVGGGGLEGRLLVKTIHLFFNVCQVNANARGRGGREIGEE